MNVFTTIKWSLLIIAVIYINFVSYQSFMKDGATRNPAGINKLKATNQEINGSNQK